MTQRTDEHGFVFTVDALFAATIAVTILTSTYVLMSKAQKDYFADAQLASIANDVLFLFDKQEMLDTLSENQIEAALLNELPSNYAAEITIYSYEYNGGFSLARTIVAKYPNVGVPDEVVRARTNFMTFQSEHVSTYNIAEIKVWLR